jgi:putative ATP-binding cassette transporter
LIWSTSGPLPNGTPLVSAGSFSLLGNERTWSPAVRQRRQSTLFRAIAGIWPFGNSSIAILRTGDDAAAAHIFRWGRCRLQSQLRKQARSFRISRGCAISVGLPGSRRALGEEAHWNRMGLPASNSALGSHARALMRHNTAR